MMTHPEQPELFPLKTTISPLSTQNGTSISRSCSSWLVLFFSRSDVADPGEPAPAGPWPWRSDDLNPKGGVSRRLHLWTLKQVKTTHVNT